MQPTKIVLAILSLAVPYVAAQTSLDTSLCASDSGVSSFSACNYLYSQINYCAGPQVATGAPFVSCYCNQQLFNAFFDCESEQRLCYRNELNDGDFQSALGIWHTACDKRLTFTPTTPVVSTLTATANAEFCTVAASACASGTVAASQCALSYTNLGSPQFSSCFCQPKLLSLQYTCLYQGNASCYGRPAALTNIPAYNFCHEATSILGSAGGSNSPSTTSDSASMSSSSATGSSGSSTITRPALPGSSSGGSGAQSTSSSTGAGTKLGVQTGIMYSVLGLLASWQAFLHLE